MLQLPIERIQAGMVMGKSIYSSTGDLLLAAGFRLQDKYIQRLKFLGYSSLYIQEEGTEHVIPESIINEQLALQTNKALRDSVEVVSAAAKVRGETKAEIEHAIKEPDRFKNIILVDRMKSVIQDILDSLLGQTDVLININSLRSQDGYLHQHNIDVAVMSIMLANRLRLSRADIAEIAMGAIMHDLGMVVIPEAIRKKGRRLTFQEFTLLKEHTTYGFSILKENPRISPVSAHVAFQHHERQDGGGYPRGLKGENSLPTQKRQNQSSNSIHRFAEIVAVADAYDLLVAPHNQEDRKTPDEALKILIRSAGTQLNKHVVDALISMTPSYPVGALVAVTEGPKEILGCKGVVSRNNRTNLERPEVIIIYNKSNRRIKPFLLDLAYFEGVNIQILLRN